MKKLAIFIFLFASCLMAQVQLGKGVQIGSGSGGSGDVLPTPQYRLFIQPNAGTQAVAGAATADANAVAPLLQGSYNTDLFGTGNNGLTTLLGAQCASGKCTAMYPGTSTSTEHVNPASNGNSTHVQDFRLGSQGDYFRNPAVAGGGGQNFVGSAFSGAKSVYANWDLPTMAAGNYQGESQTAQTFFNNFTSLGWDWGVWNTTNSYLNPLWSVQHGLVFNQTVSTQGIGQIIGGTQNKYAIGDSAGAYLYNLTDGGFIDGAGEGSVGIGLHDYQNSTWFHGTVAAGATAGTQLLPVTYVVGTNSRSQVSVGGTMLDISKPALQNAHVTGPATELASPYAVWSQPIDTTVTPSTAYGYANAAIPEPLNATVAQSDTVSFTVTGGTNAAGFTTGTACLAGGSLYEQVAITAVGTLSGGVQSVTFTHRYPNIQQGTSLWQGGPCGTYYMSTSDYYYLPISYWRTNYVVVGATDSTHIVGRFFTGSSIASLGLTYTLPIPTFWNANTANVQLTNLTVSGTTVTANFYQHSPFPVFNGISGAVISGASNSSYNGTANNIVLTNNNQTLTWQQTGVTGTATTAYISLPPNYFNFFLFPGAEVSQPATSAGVPLEPNSVNWTAGDVIENPFNPSFRGYAISSSQQVNSPDSQYQTGVGNLSATAQGSGVSGQYIFLGLQNLNGASIYKGAGGVLDAPKFISIKGPGSSAMTVDTAPLDGRAFFDLGCFTAAQGGCAGNANDYRVIGVENNVGQINFTPTTNDWYLNNIKTARLRSPVLSTGDGSYINGGFISTNPVALTSAGAVPGNSASALGAYGTFGNETVLDTSANIGAKGFYAATLYAGAQSPGTPIVQPYGTLGTTTYSYACTSVTDQGESLPSPVTTTSLGNATLSSANYITIQCLPGYGAQSINVYRTATTSSYGTGLVCANVLNKNAVTTLVASQCTDTGQTPGAAVPSADTSGFVASPKGTFGAATVAGKNVCLADGTNCVSSYITSLTTTGTSGPATVTSGVLNIPQYAGGGMVYPAAGIPVSTGSAWGSSFTAPTGAIVGTTDTQTLTNKTLGTGTSFNDGTGVGGGFLSTEGTTRAGAAGSDAFWADSTDHRFKMNNNNGGATDVVGMSDLASSSLYGVVKVDGTTITASGGVISAVGGSGIANTTITVGTTAIAANTCTSASTVTMTGVATTSVFTLTPSADVSGVTGWGSTGGLVIDAWPTANTLNYKVCNQTAASITPSASVTFNVGAR